MLQRKQRIQVYDQALKIMGVKFAHIHKLSGKYVVYFPLPEASTQARCTAG